MMMGKTRVDTMVEKQHNAKTSINLVFPLLFLPANSE